MGPVLSWEGARGLEARVLIRGGWMADGGYIKGIRGIEFKFNGVLI